jgi:hypothetical protein
VFFQKILLLLLKATEFIMEVKEFIMEVTEFPPQGHVLHQELLVPSLMDFGRLVLILLLLLWLPLLLLTRRRRRSRRRRMG